MYRTALIIALLAFLSLNKFSQEKPKSNLEIFEEAISAELEKYYYYPGVNRDVPFVFVINPDEKGGSNKNTESGSKFLNSLVKKTASSNNLKFSIADNVSQISADSAYNLMVLQVLILETRYAGFQKNKFLGEKIITRNISYKISVKLTPAGGEKNNYYISTECIDFIPYDNIKQLESPQYDFTQAEVPKISTFERIIFPVLLICVTAAATILFFTIRSK